MLCKGCSSSYYCSSCLLRNFKTLYLVLLSSALFRLLLKQSKLESHIPPPQPGPVGVGGRKADCRSRDGGAQTGFCGGSSLAFSHALFVIVIFCLFFRFAVSAINSVIQSQATSYQHWTTCQAIVQLSSLGKTVAKLPSPVAILR